MSLAVERMLILARGLPWPGAWAAGQLIAAAIALISVRRRDSALLRDFAFSLVAGAAGALALGFVYRLPGFVAGTNDPFGLAAWGALAGTAAAFALLARRRGVSPARALDLATPALLALLGIGRIGCFLGGCDAGQVSHVPWALRFPAGTEAFREHVARGLVAATDPRSLAVHPAQLYEAFGALLLALGVERLSKRPRLAGVACASGAAGYAILRLGVDHFRPSTLAADLTSIVVFAIAAAWLRARRARTSEPIRPNGRADPDAPLAGAARGPADPRSELVHRSV